MNARIWIIFYVNNNNLLISILFLSVLLTDCFVSECVSSVMPMRLGECGKQNYLIINFLTGKTWQDHSIVLIYEVPLYLSCISLRMILLVSL